MLYSLVDHHYLIDGDGFINDLKSEVKQLADHYSHLPKTLKYKIADRILYKSFDKVSILTFFNLADLIADNDPNIAKLIRESVIELVIDLEYLQYPQVREAIGLEVARSEEYLRDRAADLLPQAEENSEFAYSPVVIMAGGMHLFTALPDASRVYEFESSATAGTKLKDDVVVNSDNDAKLRDAISKRHDKQVWILDDVMDSGATFLSAVERLITMILKLDEQEGVNAQVKIILNLVAKVRSGIKLLKSKMLHSEAAVRQGVQADLKQIRELLKDEGLNIFSFFAADKISNCDDYEADHALACFGNMESPPWLMGWGMDTEIRVNINADNVAFDLNICVGRWLRDIVALDIESEHLPEPCKGLSGSERLALLVQAVFTEKLGVSECVVTLVGEP